MNINNKSLRKRKKNFLLVSSCSVFEILSFKLFPHMAVTTTEIEKKERENRLVKADDF